MQELLTTTWCESQAVDLDFKAKNSHLATSTEFRKAAKAFTIAARVLNHELAVKDLVHVMEMYPDNYEAAANAILEKLRGN